MGAGLPWLAAGLVHASLGTAVRLQYAAALQSKSLRHPVDDPEVSLALAWMLLAIAAV